MCNEEFTYIHTYKYLNNLTSIMKARQRRKVLAAEILRNKSNLNEIVNKAFVSAWLALLHVVTDTIHEQA